MGKVETQVVDVEGIQIAVPVGPIVRPTALGEAVVKAIQDPTNWKLPTKAWTALDKGLADEAAAALDFYFGGHEMVEGTCGPYKSWTVSSLGYYHYVGA